MYVGIDLGTTFSAISTVNKNGVAEIIPSIEGNSIIPSVVMCDGNNIIVGEEAKKKSIDNPYSVCQFIKRQMGSREYSFYISEEEQYTPEEVSAIILRNLIINAEKIKGEKVEGAVITVPAYFTDAQRNATKDAGEIAGINVIGIINEPTAAALAYCHDNANNDENVLIYDLGGGTFDITILSLGDNLKRIDVLSIDGINNLGGFDFDNAIMNDCIKYIRYNYGFDIEEDDELLQDLRIKAEKAKISLSSQMEALIEIQNNFRQYKYVITRDRYNFLIESAIRLTEISMEVALSDAGLSWRDISKVLLVGGSTRIPAVRQMIKNISGIEPSTELNPDEVVSLGAAYYAHDVSCGNIADFDKDNSITFVDVLSHSIGILQSSKDGSEAVTKVILKNTSLPAEGKIPAYTVDNNQTRFDIKVYQGEDEESEYDLFLGNSIINYSPKPQGYRFDFNVICNIDGIIKVQLIDTRTSSLVGEFTIDRVNNLSRKEVQTKKDKLSQSKITIPNHVVDRQPIDYKISEKNVTSDKDELNSLIGLQSVKNELFRIKSKIEFDQERSRRLGISISNTTGHHFVFYGNPGTGKTTVARLLGGILHSYGAIEKPDVIEVSRKDIVGEYIGQTSSLTKQKIEEAMGGILFIDEAYTLYRKDSEIDFGREAIEEVMKAMEDYRDRFVVILAGYKKEMTELLEANPGIESRITDYIDFPDYSDDELLEIANKMARDNHYTISSDGERAFLKLINKEKVSEKFGNARSVRRILDKAFETKAVLYHSSAGEVNRLDVLSARDFGVDLSTDASKSSREYLEELNGMIGLENVKKEVKGLMAKASYLSEEIKSGRLQEGTFVQNNNLCFTGNPGTGKTTVARIYANILHSSGILKKGHMIEASRNDFVAPHSGQTAIKTKELCAKAYGGVLFIDEAYSLVRDSNDNFGQEALDTLIKEMEDNRDKLVIILAGYSKEMKDFLEFNSGLKSRIPKFIEFCDYNEEELIEIFKSIVRQRNTVLSESAQNKLTQVIYKMYVNRDNNFGNARDIRNLYEAVWQNMVVRVIEQGLEGEARSLIEAEDFED